MKFSNRPHPQSVPRSYSNVLCLCCAGERPSRDSGMSGIFSVQGRKNVGDECIGL